MEINYEEKVLLNRQHLIDSYVSQYGEIWRDFIEKRFDEINRCFFVNPRRMKEYIKVKKEKMSKKLSLNFFKDIGLDISKIEFAQDGKFISSDTKLQKLISTFFPDTGNLADVDESQGIFVFSDVNSDNLMDRALFLKNLSFIDEVYHIYEFMRDDKYDSLEEMLALCSKIALKYKNKYQDFCQKMDMEYTNLLSQEAVIVKKYKDKYLEECLLYFSNKNGSVGKIANSSLFLGPDIQNGIYPFILNPGLLEIFSADNTEKLLNSIDLNVRQEILFARLEYLSLMGVDLQKISQFEHQLLRDDWNDISEIADFIPDSETVYYIQSIRKKCEHDCMMELANSYVLNNYKISEEEMSGDLLKEIVFDGDSKHTCHFSTKNGKCDKITVFLCPMDAGSDVLDITLDHETRHGLEYSTEMAPILGNIGDFSNGTFVERIKSGLSVNFYYDDKNMGYSNLNINEVMTQKMSIESTRERYERGIYILTAPEDVRLNYTSTYDQFIPNYDLAIPKALHEKMIQSKIQSKFPLPMYDVVSQEIFTIINNLILDNSVEAKSELREIGMQIFYDLEGANINSKKK